MATIEQLVKKHGFGVTFVRESVPDRPFTPYFKINDLSYYGLLSDQEQGFADLNLPYEDWILLSELRPSVEKSIYTLRASEDDEWLTFESYMSDADVVEFKRRFPDYEIREIPWTRQRVYLDNNDPIQTYKWKYSSKKDETE